MRLHTTITPEERHITEGHVFLVLLGVVILAGIAAGIAGHGLAPTSDTPEKKTVSDFSSCAAAGNPVMESYPRRCATVDGRVFTESVDTTLMPPAYDTGTGQPSTGDDAENDIPSDSPGARTSGGCVIGGCSGQLCVGPNEGDIVTTCIYTPAYACYATASCERQANGACGWTTTDTLTQCLETAGRDTLSPTDTLPL